jgi:hypothetical protein
MEAEEASLSTCTDWMVLGLRLWNTWVRLVGTPSMMYSGSVLPSVLTPRTRMRLLSPETVPVFSM